MLTDKDIAAFFDKTSTPHETRRIAEKLASDPAALRELLGQQRADEALRIMLGNRSRERKIKHELLAMAYGSVGSDGSDGFDHPEKRHEKHSLTANARVKDRKKSKSAPSKTKKQKQKPRKRSSKSAKPAIAAWAGVLAVVLAIALAALLAIPHPIAKLPESYGTVAVIRDGKIKLPQNSIDIYNGDIIRAESGSAHLVFADGTVCNMKTGAEAVLEMTNTPFYAPNSGTKGIKKVELKIGDFSFAVKPQPSGKPIVIVTPNLRVTASQGRFAVSVAGGQTRIETGENAICATRLSDGKKIEIPAESVAEIAPRARLKIISLHSAPIVPKPKPIPPEKTKRITVSENLKKPSSKKIAKINSSSATPAPTIAKSQHDWFQYPFSASSPWNRETSADANYFHARFASKASPKLSPTSQQTPPRKTVTPASQSKPSATPTTPKKQRPVPVQLRAEATREIIVSENPSASLRPVYYKGKFFVSLRLAPAVHFPQSEICVVDLAQKWIYEMRNATADGSQITAQKIKKISVRGSGFAPDDAGISESGGSAIGGVVRKNELAKSIRHALALRIRANALNRRAPGGKPFVAPASSAAPDAETRYSDRGNVFIGSRMAIPKSVNLDKLKLGDHAGFAYQIAKALQRYGGYVVGSCEQPQFQFCFSQNVKLPPDANAILTRLAAQLQIVEPH